MPCIHFLRRKTAQSHGLTELSHLAELPDGILTDSSAISKTKVTMGTVQTTRAPQHVDLSVLKTNTWLTQSQIILLQSAANSWVQ